MKVMSCQLCNMPGTACLLMLLKNFFTFYINCLHYILKHFQDIRKSIIFHDTELSFIQKSTIFHSPTSYSFLLEHHSWHFRCHWSRWEELSHWARWLYFLLRDCSWRCPCVLWRLGNYAAAFLARNFQLVTP